MKINYQLLKIVTRLLILLILFVMLLMISAFLYSSKYWPDVYTYINANITIKRIPTISELNITIINQYDGEYTTDLYTTTDITGTTEEYEEYTINFEEFFPDRKKRNVKIEEVKDFGEVPRSVIVHYVFEDVTTKIVKDLVDESKLTTRNMGDLEMLPLLRGQSAKMDKMSANDSIPEAFPWIATVFVKNGSSDRFDYYCDGAVYSDRVVITAARCISTPSSNPQPDSFIVILGKRSLVDNGEFQRAHRVKNILIHENFTSTSDHTENDLALLMMEEPVVWNDGISPACLDGGDGDVVDAATTGWAASGQLTAIRFDQEKSKSCQNTGRNNFCAVYGNDVSTCPSYGGLYLAKRSDWCVYGIRTGDPSERPFCFDRTVRYTSLAAYSDWLKKNAN